MIDTATIANVGFPIAMCIYLAVRGEKVLNNNTQAIREMIVEVKANGRRIRGK